MCNRCLKLPKQMTWQDAGGSSDVFVVDQSLSCVWLFVTTWIAECQAPLFFTISQTLLKLTSIESVILSNHLFFCHPLLFLPSIFPSIRVFSNESVLHIRWPNYWSFRLNISRFDEYSGLISFRIDWFDLLVVQVTLKSLLQHRNSKASLLQPLAFFMVQLLGWSFLLLHEVFHVLKNKLSVALHWLLSMWDADLFFIFGHGRKMDFSSYSASQLEGEG